MENLVKIETMESDELEKVKIRHAHFGDAALNCKKRE
jgi:hypothetical protein